MASTMSDIIKAVQKHEVEVAVNAIDHLVAEIHKVLTDKDSDLLESLEEHLGDIVNAVKESIKEESKKNAKAATGKKVKDPNAPKRAPTEYNIFIREHMSSLKEEHPDAKPKELMSMAVDAWRAHKGDDKPASKAAPRILSDTENDASDVDAKSASQKKKENAKKGKK
ncbi:hypothetical protein [Dishui Lake large algae virus 1]|nr:hypothetical protein [Dishui Lake large algae virus 1]